MYVYFLNVDVGARTKTGARTKIGARLMKKNQIAVRKVASVGKT